jgi:hypothetical protein
LRLFEDRVDAEFCKAWWQEICVRNSGKFPVALKRNGEYAQGIKAMPFTRVVD